MSSPDYRPRPPDHPPENQEVRWGWILQGYYMGRDAEAKLAALKLDLSRLQHDLSASISHNSERLDELNESLARMTKGLLKVEEDVASVNQWRARWTGVWIVLGALGPLVTLIVGGYLLFKLTGRVGP